MISSLPPWAGGLKNATHGLSLPASNLSLLEHSGTLWKRTTASLTLVTIQFPPSWVQLKFLVSHQVLKAIFALLALPVQEQAGKLTIASSQPDKTASSTADRIMAASQQPQCIILAESSPMSQVEPKLVMCCSWHG